MSKTKTKTYCLSLYCGLNLMREGYAYLINETIPDFLAERNDIDEMLRTLGDGAEWNGSGGSSTTWRVREDYMLKLLRKISEYNTRSDIKHIIHVEIY